MTTELIDLVFAATHVQVCPAAGAGIVRFYHQAEEQVYDWLRPVSEQTIASRNGHEMGSYALAPFCNRIRAGQFSFQSRSISLPLNAPPQKHSLHGHAWQAPWQVVERTDSTLTLDYHHNPDAWPWEYQVRQIIHVKHQCLHINLVIKNLSAEAMPAALGLHPFFRRTPQTRVFAQVEKIWLTDDEIMPLEHTKPEPIRDPRRGIWVNQVILDNNYSNWAGLARVQWPEWEAEMTLIADSPYDHLVIFAPTDRQVVCVEPVSQTTDALNLDPDGSLGMGMRVLDPGAVLTASAEFRYAFIAA